MIVLGINSSPRIGGNSDILLEKTLEGARTKGASTQKLDLARLNISPCSEEECGKATDERFSEVSDDIRPVFEKVRDAGAIIVASPVFFGSIPAQLKAMIDRFQSVWIAKNIYNEDIFPVRRKGGFICVQAAGRQDFFDNSKFIVKNFFATANIEYTCELLAPGVDKKGAVLEHPEFLDMAYKMGQELAS